MTFPVPKFNTKWKHDVVFVELIRDLLDLHELNSITINLVKPGELLYLAIPADSANREFDIITYELIKADSNKGFLDVHRINDPETDVLTYKYDTLNMWHAKVGKSMARAFQNYRHAVRYIDLVESMSLTYEDSGDELDKWIRDRNGNKWL